MMTIDQLDVPPEVTELLDRARDTPVTHVAERRTKDGRLIFPVECPECKTVLLWTSLKGHRKEQHKLADSSTDYEFLDRIRYHGDYTPKMGRPAPSQKERDKEAERKRIARAAKKQQPAQAKPEAKPKKVKTLDANELVNTVLESLFPKGIPVAKRTIVNEWAAATERFVREAEL